MNYFIAFLVFGVCFAGMAMGVIFAKKVLRKGCSADPTDPNTACTCKGKEQKSAECQDQG